MKTDSTAAGISEPSLSQAELLFQAQQRRVQRFRMGVAISWIVLLLFFVVVHPTSWLDDSKKGGSPSFNW